MSMKFGTYKPRFYPVKGTNPLTGEPVTAYPSVTTIGSILAKLALIPWAANCAVDYLFSGEPVKWADLDKARTAHLQASREAADYGTYIHALSEYYFKTGIEIDSPHEMTDKLMKSFYVWCKKHTVKPIATEQVVYGNGYAGRTDLVCEIDQFWYKNTNKKDQTAGRKRRVIALIDFKTGKASYYADWGLQVAAYRHGYNTEIKFNAHESQDWDNAKEDEAVDCGQLVKDYENKHLAKHHGILKFNKKTLRVNYKDYSQQYDNDYESFMDLVRFYWRNMDTKG